MFARVLALLLAPNMGHRQSKLLMLWYLWCPHPIIKSLRLKWSSIAFIASHHWSHFITVLLFLTRRHPLTRISDMDVKKTLWKDSSRYWLLYFRLNRVWKLPPSSWIKEVRSIKTRTFQSESVAAAAKSDKKKLFFASCEKFLPLDCGNKEMTAATASTEQALI